MTGCSVQINPSAWTLMPEVDRVIGIKERDKLSEYLVFRPGEQTVTVGSPSGGVDGPPAISGHKSRPFLKIQDGCSRGCTYCIVPRARGPERSRTPDRIIEDIERLSNEGFREIVLTGIHLGRWGIDLGENFQTLLDYLDRVKSDVRIRLSSIEPMDLTPDLVHRILTHKLICPHLHIPLQSGDQAILDSMGRGHSIGHFSNLLDAIIKTRPDAAIGTDILVGFPGETPESFEKTVSYVSSQPFTYLHIFSWSPREGTKASLMKNRPRGSSVIERVKILKGIDLEKRKTFMNANQGMKRPFLIEIPSGKSNKLTALSDNYIRALVECPKASISPGTIATLIIDINNEPEFGKPVGKIPE
ncbi:MAG: MiaB/RimO family radical SAM methylthiotransferase [bacterium]